MGRNLILALFASALLLLVGSVVASHYFRRSPPPDEAESHWRLANEFIAAREYPQALAHLTHCLEAWPFNAEAHFLMARTSRRAGHLQDFRKHLEEAAILHWPRSQIDLEQQLRRAQVGDLWEIEEALLDRLNARPPEEVLILEALVHGLMENDRLVDVVVLATTWSRQFPQDWLPLIYGANARLRLNDKSENVLKDFERVLELKRDNAESHLSLAIVLTSAGDFEKALPHFQAAAVSQPDDPPVLFGLANCLYSLGQSQEARVVLNRLLVKDKKHAAGLYLQAKIELAEDSPMQAYDWLKKADKQAPKEVDVTTSLMAVCGLLGKTEEANHYHHLLEEIRARDAELDRLATAVKSRPEDTALRYELGMACLKLGRNVEAAHWFQGVLWKEPGHPPTLNALVEYYEKNGNRKLAEHYRQKAARATSKSASK